MFCVPLALMFVADPPRVDLYGDPLPAGAVARLGTLERSRINLRHFHFAPDGKTFHATARGPAWVQFDAATGKRTRVVSLPGLDGSWPWVSADGSTAVVPQPGGPHNIVDVQTGKVLLTLPATVAFGHVLEPLSPNGRFFAAADRYQSSGQLQKLTVWDTQSGATSDLGTINDGVHQTIFSPDGSRLFVVGNKVASCWDVAGQKELWRAACENGVWGVKFRPDGKAMIVPGRTGRPFLELLDVQTGQPVTDVKQPPDTRNTFALGFTADGRRLATRTYDNQKWAIRFWDMAAGAWQETSAGVSGDVISPTGEFVLTWQSGSHLQLIDIRTGKPCYPDVGDRGHTQYISDVIFDASGTRAYTSARDGVVRVWEPRTGRLVRSLHLPAAERSDGGGLSISRGGTRLLVDERDQRSDGRTYTILNPISGAVERTIPDAGRPTESARVYHSPARLSADGLTIRANRYEQVYSRRSPADLIRVLTQTWDVGTGRATAARLIPVSPVLQDYYFPVSPDGRLTTDGRVVCELPSGRVVAQLESAEFTRHGVPAYSADGRFLALKLRVLDKFSRPVAGALPAVWVWDVLHARVVGRVTVGADHMKLTPDGRFLVTLDATGVSAWDVASGRQLVHHRADPRSFYFEGRDHTTAIAVSADGRLAVTARVDGTALVWDMAGAYAAAVNVTPPAAAEMAATWAAFAAPNAGDHLGRMWRLVDHPAAAVPFLREKVRAAVTPYVVPADADLHALAAALDDDDYPTREAAQKRLGDVGEPARKVLMEVLRNTKSVEQRNRLSQLLTRLDTMPVPPLAPEDAAVAWALAVLERIATPEARDVVRHIAAGPPASRLTREATAAIERMPK